MPLLRRRPVTILPIPTFDPATEGQDPQVFYLKATGEIFKDYESYASRLTFLLTRQFQCEYSGKTNLDYFSALQSEKEESRIVRERFPDVLKGRVLASVQFRVVGRLDALVDLVFERYKDRFFPNEQCFVDLGGDKYFAKISTVFPPQSVRDAAVKQQQAALAEEAQTASSVASTSSSPPMQRPTIPLDYAAIAHKLGTDLDVDAEVARREDNPDEYLYTLQLMDEAHKFEGSTMEVRAKSLSRDRLTFSKSILKRYLRECLDRDAMIGAPWIVKPSVARAFGIPIQQKMEAIERVHQDREAKLAKRRRTYTPLSEKVPRGYRAPPRKPKLEDTPEAGSEPPAEAEKPRPRLEPKPRAIKYPIEDLDLDPMSIFDGRLLRRVHTELPPLPPKPQPKRTLPVPPEHFDRFVETWNALNIFAKPLNLSTFSMDDYAGALTHDTLSPRCILLVELHASVTNVLGTDASRALGSTTAVASRRPTGDAPSAEDIGSTKGEDDDEEDQLEQDELEPGSTPAPAGSNGGAPSANGADGPDEIPYEETEMNKLVRLGIAYAKRWDRQAKLKYSEGRDGWERHLVGALCQRGGPIYMPNFVRIMRHLFVDHPELPERDPEPDAMALDEDGRDNVVANGGEPNASSAASDSGVSSRPSRVRSTHANGHGERPSGQTANFADDSPGNVELQYLSLSLEDKLDILAYLVTLVMGTKAVRSYMEESELKLTELRKSRADVNKERRALLEQKAAEENGGVGKQNDTSKAATGASGANGTRASSTAPATSPMATRAPGTPKERMSSQSPKPPLPGKGNVPANEEEEDQLASDDDDTSSVAPSESGSTTNFSRRQTVLEKKRWEKVREARASSVASSIGGRKQRGAEAPVSLDEQIRLNGERDEHMEREFRRYLGVTRCRPFGRDRFHCEYWWFDGIGSMNLTGTGKGEVIYGTGRLFVQGPKEEEWAALASSRGLGEDGEAALRERRMLEEGADGPEALLGPHEWAFYEDDEELDNLVNWLNSKGSRELALKNAIAKWRPFITAGAKKRHHDAAHPDLPRYDHGGRRSGRKDLSVEVGNTYLGWRNSLARF